jgi:hypothetical protein
MIAFVRAVSRCSASHPDLEALKTLLLFSAAGHSLRCFFCLDGIDIGPGLF